MKHHNLLFAYKVFLYGFCGSFLFTSLDNMRSANETEPPMLAAPMLEEMKVVEPKDDEMVMLVGLGLLWVPQLL